MNEAIQKVLELIRSGKDLDDKTVERILRSFNRGSSVRSISKKSLLPFYLNERKLRSDIYDSWNIDEEMHQRIVELLRAKPGRTASGVATVSVLMKPWPCGGSCIYCPNDIRMPKSYLSDEPACQRAEMAYFDPYLQVVRRLMVLEDMGHNTDKVELIVLGGTFDDYSIMYRRWFINQLFEALNDLSDGNAQEECEKRERYYEGLGLHASPDEIAHDALMTQSRLDVHEVSYNVAISENPYWEVADEREVIDRLACKNSLVNEHERNENSSYKCVGLVIETRPECITYENLTEKRKLGCTKIQVGIQSLDAEILSRNSRTTSLDDIDRAFSLLREFGFKSHIHLMQNLPYANLATDEADYIKLIDDIRYKPDEIKLYPCALVESAEMKVLADKGQWHGYETNDLIDLLSELVKMTPRYTRISRMIRDIPSTDIIGGNKITNLRQLVEQKLKDEGSVLQEIRMREVRTGNVDVKRLTLRRTDYSTSNTTEVFLEYTDEDDKLAGFLRLSLPLDKAADAMIREVHVYGKVAKIGKTVESAQHSGLGRSLIDAALRISAHDGRSAVKVISAVGTRVYYRNLGFKDEELYQRIEL